jgi:hypothetical protein
VRDAALFARALREYTGRECLGFLSLLQEVRAMGNTHNQFLRDCTSLILSTVLPAHRASERFAVPIRPRSKEVIKVL